jgi:hypothetical protein
MTSRTHILIFLLLTVIFISCDPGIGVAIANKSSSDKEIKVIYPSTFKFPGATQYDLNIRDSVKIFDLTKKEKYTTQAFIPYSSWDTVSRTYTFKLKSNQEALVENRFLTALPTFGQIFIIDNNDTIKLIRHGKDFIKRPKLLLGGTWTHTIKDEQ